MTNEEMLQHNRMCAEFLGYELITPKMRQNPSTWKYSYWEHKDIENVRASIRVLGEQYSIHFHSDWNWIMKIVEAIEKMGHTVDVYNNVCIIPHLKKSIADTKKEAVVQAINQFLIWYNEQTNI